MQILLATLSIRILHLRLLNQVKTCDVERNICQALPPRRRQSPRASFRFLVLGGVQTSVLRACST